MVGLLLLLAPVPDAPEPPAALPPVIRYVGHREASAVFVVTNPGPVPVTFIGYPLDPLSRPLAAGMCNPIYLLERKVAGNWQPRLQGWRIAGTVPITVKPKESIRFEVGLPLGESRLGLEWRAGGQAATAWSAPFYHDPNVN